MSPARIRAAVGRVLRRARGRAAGPAPARGSWSVLVAGLVVAAAVVGAGVAQDGSAGGRSTPSLPPGVASTGDPVADAYVAEWQRGCTALRAATTRGVREIRAAGAGARSPSDVRRRSVAPALRYLDRTSDVLGRLRVARPPARWAAYQRQAARTLGAARADVARARRRAAAGDVAALARLRPAEDPGGPAPADLRRRTPACGAAADGSSA